jgi:Spy/CpxP family protein refolding chaperone
MKTRLASIGAALLFAAAPAHADDAHERPYAGEDRRAVKALSAEEVDGLLAGAGLGYAKAAELNGWPGPLHALELEAALSLTPAQVEAMQRARAGMLAAARPLGAALIEAERRLDALFAEGAPTPAAVEAASAAAAEIEGRLRAAHLEAHIAARDILTRHQRVLYAEARGYAPAGHEGQHHR